MITFRDLYSVLSAVVPLYVTMFLAYLSVKWWKIFTPDQCAGINRFVAIFAVPLLSFEFISRINPYKMDLLFIAADGVSKVLILLVLFCWAKFSKRGSLDWAITLFSLSTLPNTLVMGIPLLKSMEARILILQKFNGSSASNTQRSLRIWDRQILIHRQHRNLTKVAPDSRHSSQLSAAENGARRCCEQSVQSCRSQEENNIKGKTGEGEKSVTSRGFLSTSSSISSKMLRLILKTVWLSFVRNPNSYASLLGLSWALASCRWGIKKPQIMENSVTILSDAGLGMAMSVMALQPRIIACGNRLAVYGMLVRFVAGPAVMAVACHWGRRYRRE
ncbi:hypothetical protein HHK36_007709 [Tetracentron sinense]|uniref:PIN-like protein n=1 Tax=Tetracentron sinense TaxID=13715 RepID=A0A835DIM9_TETSI|nr:hypothetical protein HHK36_007709 [Tetracentron sinense]